jgi:ABC-type multidrug transport system fused ATPase/permease subunit
VQLEEEIESVERETSEFHLPLSDQRDLRFENEITVQNLSFEYVGATNPVLKDFNLTIRRNESVGIAGVSGSGKSTLVDLILGLHTPQSGAIMIDGEMLTRGNIDSWRRMIGYVPQDIYLLDDTIEANIALGFSPEKINLDALRSAAEGAQILNFIEMDLPNGFQTIVGERGVRLSGGQRQRIGLARALYHKPQILILDEATSALDNETELAVMETIHKLQGSLTIITIAHRLTTLEKCDRIIKLKT